MLKLLFFKGIVDDFNDFDILLPLEEEENFKKAISSVGISLLPTEQKGCFSSPYYQEALFGRLHFDLIASFTVNTYGGAYTYPYKASEAENLILEGGIILPIIPVEANLVLYGMMEGWQAKRRFKRELCYEFLQENGVSHPEVLEAALRQQIPGWMKEVITSLL